MSKRERWIIALSLVAVVVAALPWILPLFWREMVAPKEASAAARGRVAAEELGCFTCHGPGGTGGVPDPGAGAGETVPAFTGGVPWQYAEDVRELENWILDGDPKGRGGIERQHGKERHPTPAPAAVAGTAAAPVLASEPPEEHEGLLKMPAFRDHLREGQLDDLIALILALSPKTPPPDPAVRRGLELANRNGCFACHGAMGSGGNPNPGSFKGYIPGFSGGDLRELAADRAEVEAWIRDGNVARLEKNPGARFFLDRQPIKMPAYDEQLSDSEVADLVSLVEWIHSQP